MSPIPTTPSKPAIFALTGAAPIEDRDGYTFLIMYDFSFSGDIEKDIADDVPGKASARIKLNPSGTEPDYQGAIQNQTTGRNASALFARKLGVTAIYARTSKVCALPDAIEVEDSYCGLRLAFAGFEANAVNLTGGGMLYFPLSPAGQLRGTSQSLRVRGIPEDDWDEIVAALISPKSVLLHSDTPMPPGMYPKACTFTTDETTTIRVLLASSSAPAFCD